VVFGLLGKIKDEAYGSSPVKICVAVTALLAVLGVASGLCAGLDIIKTSPLYAATMRVLLWVICGICAGQLVLVNIVTARIVKGKSGKRALKLLLFAATACTLTVCFTLLDDVISPLFYGMSGGAALTYFYASFTAMLPQVLCAAVTTVVLAPALWAVLSRACPFCVDKRFKKL
ncbi:MAG: hypothetical protein K2N47_03930, partial [Clostridia bacterium]|nr:hypothetical protein [Clostridia bacterium]